MERREIAEIVFGTVLVSIFAFSCSSAHPVQKDNNTLSDLDIFSLYDLNKDNHLSPSEVLLLTLRRDPNRAVLMDNLITHVKNVFREYEIDGDGKLTFNEYSHAIAQPSVFVTNSEVMALFETFDLNADGTISFDEIAVVFQSSLTPEIQRDVEAADQNGDTRISYEEFAIYLRERPPTSST